MMNEQIAWLKLHDFAGYAKYRYLFHICHYFNRKYMSFCCFGIEVQL